MNNKLTKSFLNQLEKVKGKRSRIVVNHIIKHGYISTEDLKDIYGYSHPPRAVRDVREQGIPIETFDMTGKDGRKIAAYRFGDPSKIRNDRLAGRRTFPKSLKKSLIKSYGSYCAICLCKYEERYLQVDHRIPYEVAGDIKSDYDPKDFMLICGSCNRAKSWSCEHCHNWTTDHQNSVCEICYWANPNEYSHIALRKIRRLDIVWNESEIGTYNTIVRLSEKANKKLPEFVKKVLRNHIDSMGKRRG